MQRRILIPAAGRVELEGFSDDLTVTTDETQNPQLMVSKPGEDDFSLLLVEGSEVDVINALVSAIDVCGMSASMEHIQAERPGTSGVFISYLEWLGDARHTSDMLRQFIKNPTPRTPVEE